MSNPTLTPEERDYLGVGSLSPTNPVQSSNAMEALTAFLARVDWNKLFLRAAIALNAAGLLYVSSNFLIYARYFGFSSLAFVGQLLIGLFFLMTVWSTTDGLRIMIASIGMYILANSF